MALLETLQLCKSFGAHRAVNELEISVEEGEIFALLGPNGAGKTTTISMICGVVSPSSGKVLVAGKECSTRVRETRRLLGLVPQDLAVYDDLSAVENLRYFGALYGLSGAELRDRIDEAVDIAGIQDRASDLVRTFSGGMKRRLNLVASLLHRPRLLVLDEPTVGVDPQSRNHIFESIRRLNRDHGVTVLYTSHYLEEVQALCERVAILDRGQCIAMDRVDSLLALHASSGLELQFVGGGERLRRATAHLEGVSVDDGRLLAPEGADAREILRAALDSEVEIVSLKTARPTLEQVFLSLTGVDLRDRN